MSSVARPCVLVVASVLILASGCSAVGDARGAAGDDSCPDVQVVGVRGQSQSLTKNQGLGEEVKGVVTALRADLADRGVDRVTVEAVKHRSRDSAEREVYDADVADGRDKLDALLRTRVEQCPDSRTVVVGFSQGAQIAQETLAATPRLARKVDALGLIGSPRHDPAAGFTEVDLPGPTAGLEGSLGAGPDLGALTERTVDACLSQDVVCDADGGTDYTVHKKGYEPAAIARRVADALDRVLRD
jgi:pimeloyl-ACP methyl ester carboxylesterase